MQEVQAFANKAATDLSGKAGYAVKYDTSGMNVCSAITDQAVGILVRGGDDTELQSDVCVFGRCAGILGGTVSRGQMITPHTDGTLVVTAQSGCTEFAIALEDGVAGDWIQFFVFGSQKAWA